MIEKRDRLVLSFDLQQSPEFEISKDFLNIMNMELQYQLGYQINSVYTRTE